MTNFCKLLANILALSLLLLVSCKQKNPLKTHSMNESVIFLINASANAEKRLNFAIQKDSYGYGYLECMDSKKSPEIDCERLLKGMESFAKEGHYPTFKSITLTDLTDKDLFEHLANHYAETAATTWPQLVSVGKS